MPDCTELQNAVDASLAIIDGILANLDAELIVLQDRITALDECMMGEFETATMSRLDTIQSGLNSGKSKITEIKAAILNGEGTHPAIDEGGAGPAPDSGSGPGFDDGSDPGPAPDGDSGGSAAAP